NSSRPAGQPPCPGEAKSPGRELDWRHGVSADNSTGALPRPDQRNRTASRRCRPLARAHPRRVRDRRGPDRAPVAPGVRHRQVLDRLATRPADHRRGRPGRRDPGPGGPPRRPRRSGPVYPRRYLRRRARAVAPAHLMGHLPSHSSYRSDPEKGKTMTQLAKVFELNRQGLNIARGVAIAVVLLLPLVVLGLIHQDQYWLSVSFGAMFVVLAAFVVTLLGGLAVKFGVHRFAQATLLNVWFIIAITLPDAYRADHIHPNAWAQALAWLIGSALWIAFTCIVWLARGRTAEPSPVPEIPGDTSPVKLTRPIILFALIRAIALAGAVAIAFGLHLPNADWMPLATIVAMKPSLQQSMLVGEQRVAGTIIGAA